MKPTATYRLRVIFVLGSLLLFLLLYIALVAASGYLVYWIWNLPTPRGRGALLKFSSVVGAAMLFLFFLKGLFKRKSVDQEGIVKISAAEEPALFHFVRRLCAESGSHFPSGIYLSHDVNAAVFYPRSLFSLIWPLRKNLLIGLGLVNAISLSELKAVLAHEFGHFAQSSMKLGQYVYVANQVIADMVFGRDHWDRLLDKWRGIDIRLSFPAWILSGVVWGLRHALGFAFRGINILNFSLSRQMEFNADLHAVALTGSDAIISALWKIERGNIAFNMALSELGSVAQHGKYSEDVYFHHTAATKRLEQRLQQDAPRNQDAARLARPYVHGAAIHFEEDGEPTSAMWRTHPSHRQRELNAKAVYVADEPVARPAWDLFVAGVKHRLALSRIAYRDGLGVLLGLNRETVPAAEIHALIEEEKGEMKQADRYFGFYEDRLVRPGEIGSHAAEIDAAEALGSVDAAKLEAEARVWTGEPLRRFMDRLRGLHEEKKDAAAAEEAQKELKEIYETVLPAGDAALFRYFYHLSGKGAAAGAERRAELVARYRFLIDVEEQLGALNQADRNLQHVMAYFQQGRPSESQVKQILGAFDDAWRQLQEVVDKCASIAMPRLQHLQEGKSVHSFILEGSLVPRFEEGRLSGEWINGFLRQFHDVLGRLRKLHYKNLGLLLKLQEELDPAFLGESQAAAS